MGTLNGVDVSGHNWGNGRNANPIRLREVEGDFFIIKSTEGTQGTIYNTRYREMAEQALSTGRLLGFYHYANGGDPIAEADCFYDSIKDYRGRCVPCLDWEGQGNRLFETCADVDWCKRFMDRISSRMGSTCLFYTSKGVCNEFDWSPCASYPLWGAEYPDYDDVYGYQDEPWQSRAGWGAWGRYPTIHQYTSTLVLERNGGCDYFDGNLFYGSKADWKKMCGGDGKVTTIYLNNEAAEIHYFMATDPRFGYNQQPTRWGESGGEVVVFISSSGRKYRIPVGDFDCSSSTILCWRLVVVGTPYEGAFDNATCTSDMREVFVNSGLFYAKLSAAKRGDLYLNEGVHVAMCQDGGSDGVFGWDCLTEFNRNENHAASWGESGDQDGYESVFRGYYDDGWNTVLHYNGKADFYIEEEKVKPKQDAGKPKNDVGIKYNAHVADVGWLDVVRDGQTAGTVGYGKRLEAITVNPPAGWELRFKLHIQNVGWKVYTGIAHGNATIIGQTGKGRAIECMIVDVTKHPEGDKRKLYFQVHQANLGWKGETPQGFASGTDGMGIRLEAVRIWIA